MCRVWVYQSETGAVTRRSRRQSRWSAPVTAQRRVELADQSDTGRREGESGRGMVYTALRTRVGLVQI